MKLIIHNRNADGFLVVGEGETLRNDYGTPFGVQYQEATTETAKFILVCPYCGCDGCRGLSDVWDQVRIRRVSNEKR